MISLASANVRYHSDLTRAEVLFNVMQEISDLMNKSMQKINDFTVDVNFKQSDTDDLFCLITFRQIDSQ